MEKIVGREGSVPEPTGLGNTPKSEWPEEPELGKKPIEIVKPGSEEHARVLDYMLRRLCESEEKMTMFYSRWEVNEKKLQAYVDLEDYEKLLKDMNDKSSRPAQAISITVPYSWATVMTIVTYLAHTFCRRKPLVQVSSNKPNQAENAKNMETVLQYQAEHSRFVKHMMQFLLDSMVYSIGVMRVLWEQKHAKRTRRKKMPKLGFYGDQQGEQTLTLRERALVYEGNKVECIDPFLFFPDPRVPLVDVNKLGEYVFCRSFHGKHLLKQMELEGTFRYIDHCSSKLPENTSTASAGAASSRALRSQGDAIPGQDTTNSAYRASTMQVDQGTIWIIPKELGVGQGEAPELWICTLVNKGQIVQLEPYDVDHGMHPVAVTEPTGVGHGFGQLAMVDLMGPIQDLISWMLNSHIANVRTVINNQIVVDPARIEMEDLKKPEAGRIIRMKRAALGMNAKDVVHQLQVSDVTANHVKDIEVLVRMGQYLSSTSDNVMGLQDQGGRKTATEVRATGEAAASRLASMAQLISAQAVVDIAEMMAVNTQQYLSTEFALHVIGERAVQNPITITPDMLNGDFVYPVADGTLPLDRVALLDVWKEIFIAVERSPLLQQQFSLPKIFEWIAELGGARNIDAMKLNVVPDAQLAQMQQAGSVVPLGGGAPQEAPMGAPPVAPMQPA